MAKSPKKKNKKVGELERVVNQIETKYGEGSLMRLGSKPATDIPAVSTGSLQLDYILGIGGVPCGRIIEIFGPESGGKTTLALEIVAAGQKLGKEIVYIDAENALDPKYARAIGVDVDNMFLSQPETMEASLEICDEVIRSGEVGVVVVDSVAAMVPKAELDGKIGDKHVGLQARLMSQALRRIAGAAAKNGTIVIFINQIREKIGVMFGNPETTPGGRALKFFSSVRIDIRKAKSIVEGDEIIGSSHRARVVKNKVAPPFKNAEFPLRYGYGIWSEAELIELGTHYKLIQKSGSWYNAKDGSVTLGQGLRKAANYLNEDLDLKEEIISTLKEKLGIK
ncbi:recombinase RecA [bacterium]|nr:recombinase RecA [bacterium]|tara:strand:- start:32754 stop:33767 length:1014 start_codon:yes stop_codon:yes gene_type:complete